MRELRQQQLQSIREYIDKVLFPALNYSGAYNLRPATAGRNSYVFFLDCTGFKPLLIRGEANKTNLLRRLRGHQILLKHDFDVPQILHYDLNRSTNRKFGFYFLVETLIPGRHFNDDAVDRHNAAKRLGKTLARMHDLTSLRYGWPGEWRWSGRIIPAFHLRWKIRALLEAYKKYNKMSAEVVADSLRQNYNSLWLLKPRLTTGGYIPSNLLIDKDRVVIIDLAYVRYAFASRDIAQIHFALLENNPQAIKIFSEAYRQYASKALAKEIDTTLPLFKILFLLKNILKENDKNRYAELDQKLINYCKMSS